MAGNTTATIAQQLGRNAENETLRFLKKNGLRLITRNYHCRMGEIDLLMRERNCLVIVEVRYRKNNRYASGAISVDRHKQAKLARTAEFFLTQHRKYCNFTVRFDVVAFNQVHDVECKLQWIKDAFRPEAAY